MEHPVTGQGLPTYGTNVLVNTLNEADGLPTKNFRTGRFDRADKISGETMHDVIVSRGGKPTHGCHAGCVTKGTSTSGPVLLSTMIAGRNFSGKNVRPIKLLGILRTRKWNRYSIFKHRNNLSNGSSNRPRKGASLFGAGSRL